MPSPILLSTPKKPEQYFDDAFIASVREKLLAHVELDLKTQKLSEESSKNKSNLLAYEQVDIEKLKTDDWFIRRFLKWEPTSVEQAVKTMQQVLAWRKRISINHW